jgi:hypothetical protein
MVSLRLPWSIVSLWRRRKLSFRTFHMPRHILLEMFSAMGSTVQSYAAYWLIFRLQKHSSNPTTTIFLPRAQFRY